MHGLRAAGLERGDAFAIVLPNSAEFFTAHLAASQAGFYLVPINHHFVAPEIAWIVADSGAKVFLAGGFADAARHAADEAALRRPTGTPSARSRASAVRRTPRRTTGVAAPRAVSSAGS